MSNTLTTPNFFDIVRDVELETTAPDSWQRRAIEWAAFADRQRSVGFRIAIGAPT